MELQQPFWNIEVLWKMETMVWGRRVRKTGGVQVPDDIIEPPYESWIANLQTYFMWEKLDL